MVSVQARSVIRALNDVKGPIFLENAKLSGDDFAVLFEANFF